MVVAKRLNAVKIKYDVSVGVNEEVAARLLLVDEALELHVV